MFGSDYLGTFGLPTMPEGWDQPPSQPLQWQGVDANPFFGGAGPGAPGMTGGGHGSANPSVPALLSGDPLAQGAEGSPLSKGALGTQPAGNLTGGAGSPAGAPPAGGGPTLAGPRQGLNALDRVSGGALSALPPWLAPYMAKGGFGG